MKIENCELIIPVCLKDKIDSIGFTSHQLNRAYKFIGILLKKLREEHYTVDYMPLPAKYLVRTFGSLYIQILNPLKSVGIIEVKGRFDNESNRFKESYEPGKFCKAIRLNPYYFSSDYVKVAYTQKVGQEYIYLNKRKFKKSILENDLCDLVIDKRKLMQVTDSYVNSIVASTFKVDKQIDALNFEIENINYDGHYSLNTALKIAARLNLNLIQDDKKFYLYKLDKYVEEKRKKVQWNYTNNIDRLSEQKFYIGRNSTNNRLDHNLTGLSKVLLQIIKEDNGLIEIDLKNSQFAILAYILENDKSYSKSNDFYVFKEQVANGTLYEFIQKQFNLATRDEAKSSMMELAFSSHNNRTALKKKLKQLFPSVVKYVDTFKAKAVKQYGTRQHKRFAIKLQKKEAAIFVDNIYYNLKKQGYCVITKHDSLLVKSKDAVQITEYVTGYFQSINFECTLN